MTDLPPSVKYVILGAGIHGLSTGWHLAMELEQRKRGSGADIVILDKTGVGAGASGIACGCVRNLYMTGPLHAILRHSVDVWSYDPVAFGFQQVGYVGAAEEKELVLTAEDETKLRNMNDILQQKLVRRGVPLKALSYGNIEPAAGGTVRQRVQIQQGIPQEKAKDIVKLIKDSKAKVQASIQGDTVRVTGRDRDTLQQVIATLKARDFGINMQFTNYRSN